MPLRSNLPPLSPVTSRLSTFLPRARRPSTRGIVAAPTREPAGERNGRRPSIFARPASILVTDASDVLEPLARVSNVTIAKSAPDTRRSREPQREPTRRTEAAEAAALIAGGNEPARRIFSARLLILVSRHFNRISCLMTKHRAADIPAPPPSAHLPFRERAPMGRVTGNSRR